MAPEEDVPGVDPARCPLCGGSNRCAMADADTRPAVLAGQLDCWCMQTRLDPVRLAQQLPPEARGRACLCPACAAALAMGGEPPE